LITLLIGIVSDSHDCLPKIDRAVTLLNSLGADNVLHAGDYCAPFAALRFGGLKTKMYGVFGNNDAEKYLLQTKFQALGHELRGQFAGLELGGIKIALLHGDEPELLQAIINSQAYDLVVSGHTHSISQSKNGKTIALNPGEICGYVSGKSTIATFETSSRRVEILDI